MHRSKRGLCRHAVSVRLSVCPSVTFVDHVEMNKHIFEIFSPSSSHTILVFLYQRGCRYSDGNPPPPNGCVKCRCGRQKTRFSTNIWLYWALCIGAWSIYRVTLIGVFVGHFRINLHQTRMQYSNEGPQHGTQPNFQKTLSTCRILSPKNSCSQFSSLREQQICSCQKPINDVTPTSDTPSLRYRPLGTNST